MAALELQRLIGLSGRAPVLSAGDSLVYAVGSAAVSRNGDAPLQFLRQHTNEITCFASSKSGRYLASGQKAMLGFPAPVVVWDMATGQAVKTLDLHCVKVQAVAFSPCERYVATLGGEDDGNLVMWSLETGKALCGAPAHSDFTHCLAFCHHDSHRLVTGGSGHLRVWHFDPEAVKLRPTDVAMGTVRRDFTCLEIDAEDSCVYAGSSSGDVVQVNLSRCILRNSGPAKDKVHRGVTSMRLLPGGRQLLLGGGDGSVTVLAVDADMGADPKSLNKLARLLSTQVASSAITSLLLDPASSTSGAKTGGGGKLPLLCSTASGEMFKLAYSPAGGSMVAELAQTAPSSAVTDAAFPAGYDEVFATAEHGAIRVWHASSGRELLRVNVPNVSCKCVAFAQDGKSIVSGWGDGCIRAFGPQSGKLLYTIRDAHPKGATAIAGTLDSLRVLSGGEEGAVRVWRIGRDSQGLEASMKEHAQAVNCITLRGDGQQVATASSDGSVILWDLATFKRSAQLLDSTTFKAVLYHPGGSELAVCGSNRSIAYCDARPPCEQLRKLEASQTDAINSLDMDGSGRVMVSGGADGEVKVWDFEEGRCLAVGRGHSGVVARVRVAPGGGYILSVGTEGAIMLWRCPQLAKAQ